MLPPETPQQISLDLAAGPRMTRDDFIAGQSNRAALEIIERWPAWGSTVTILSGPAGSGKSHLAAIWQERAKAIRIAPAGLGGIVQSAPPQQALIEDLDGSAFDEPALFHLINALQQSGGLLLITSRLRPRDWRISLADLRSRLTSAMSVAIDEPNDTLLAAVIAKLFADRQVDVDASVISFLVNRMERSLAAAVDIVDRLDRLALERQVRISRSLAASLVPGVDPGQAELDL